MERRVRPADEKLHFLDSITILFLSRGTPLWVYPIKARQENKNTKNVSSRGYKKLAHDTRNNLVTMEFNTKYRYNCFRKQSHIDTCTEGFRELERFGFEFGEFVFAGAHAHFQVDIPKRYSIEVAEIMLKSHSAKRMFERAPWVHKSEQTPSVRLIRAKNGKYGWRIYYSHENEYKVLETIEKIDKELREKYSAR